MGAGVLLEVELAALPGDAGEAGAEGGAQSLVGVAGDHTGEAEATGFEGLEESAPVDFGFGEGDGAAEDGAFAVGFSDADGDEEGGADDLAAGPDFLVGGVDNEVGDGVFYGAFSPGLEYGIEGGGGAADVGGGGFEAAEFAHDFWTLRVETPWMYIWATAILRACSLRWPRLREVG